MKPDNQNNRGKGGGDNNRRNMTAIVSIVLWALIIVVLFNYITSMAQKANTEEIKQGAAVYYDAAAEAITATADGNTPAGYAAADAATTATSVLVKLLG